MSATEWIDIGFKSISLLFVVIISPFVLVITKQITTFVKDFNQVKTDIQEFRVDFVKTTTILEEHVKSDRANFTRIDQDINYLWDKVGQFPRRDHEGSSTGGSKDN